MRSETPAAAPPQSADAATVATTICRDEWGRFVALLVRETGYLELAEDAVQDAFAAALATWPEEGVPERPHAWLRVVARRKAIDRLRRNRTTLLTPELLGKLA